MSKMDTGKAKRRITTYCCVPQCTNYERQGLSFHHFPLDEKARIRWEKVVRLEKPATRFMRVCSEHFMESDYFPALSKIRRLKRNVTPSRKLPGPARQPVMRQQTVTTGTSTPNNEKPPKIPLVPDWPQVYIKIEPMQEHWMGASSTPKSIPPATTVTTTSQAHWNAPPEFDVSVTFEPLEIKLEPPDTYEVPLLNVHVKQEQVETVEDRDKYTFEEIETTVKTEPIDCKADEENQTGMQNNDTMRDFEAEEETSKPVVDEDCKVTQNPNVEKASEPTITNSVPEKRDPKPSPSIHKKKFVKAELLPINPIHLMIEKKKKNGGDKNKIEEVVEYYPSGLPRKRKTAQCPVCEKTLCSRYSMKKHLETVHSSRIECSKCNRMFISFAHLQTHNYSLHGGDIPCNKCGKIYPSRRTLHKHKYYAHAHENVGFICDICKKNFTQKCNLVRHLNLVHPAGSLPCPQCDNLFRNERILRRHLKWSHPTEETVYNCHRCSKILPTADHYRDHMAEAHQWYSNINCDVCNKMFKNKTLLHIHQSKAHREKSVEVKIEVSATPSDSSRICHLCYNVFADHVALKRHLEVAHTSVTYPCDVCKKAFTTLRSLNRHVKDVHLNPNSMIASCRHCQKSYKSEKGLRNHLKTSHDIDGRVNYTWYRDD